MFTLFTSFDEVIDFVVQVIYENIHTYNVFCYINVEIQTCIYMEHDQREKEDIQCIGKIVLTLVVFFFVLLNRILHLEKKIHLRIMANFREYSRILFETFSEID